MVCRRRRQGCPVRRWFGSCGRGDSGWASRPVAGLIYGAATWRGMGTNAGRGVEGKTWVAAGCIGALIIGLAPTIVSTFFSTGSAG